MHIYVSFRFAICERYLAEGCVRAQPMKAREASFYGVLTARVVKWLRGERRGRSLPPPQCSYCFNPWRPYIALLHPSPYQPSLLPSPFHLLTTPNSSFSNPRLLPLSFTMYRGWKDGASCYALLCA